MMESRPESLEEWLFLLETRQQQEIQLGLTRVRQAADELGLLCPEATVITVAGTNGKGSTVALLESIYNNSGYAVASYTSPHLIHFNDRIRVGKEPISDAQLIAAFEVVETTTVFENLTYFEVTTLAALWHFKQFPLDVIILEVGLGGRLDATNIIDCNLAIITTIAIDHEAWLGNTIDAIGYEKAGILREKIPFIYADTNIPNSILQQADTLSAPAYCYGVDYNYQVTQEDKILLSFRNQLFELPRSQFHSNSVAAAVMATLCLQGALPVDHDDIVRGISSTVLNGRQQLITRHCRIIFDVAHNPQSAAYLATYLARVEGAKVHAVFSALTDKDIPGLISPLKSQVNYWYPTILPGKRAASQAQLMDAFKANDVNEILCYNNPLLAFDAACSQASTDDLIVVYGSFIIVGLILSTLSNPLPVRR